MKKLILLGIVGALAYTQRADASMLISISANAASAVCDNSTGAGVLACAAAGFVTSLDANTISYGPGFSVGGYNFTGASGAAANVPGDPLFSNLSDSKLSIDHVSGAGDLTINFAAWNYSLPVGPNMILSTSSSGIWNVAQAGDSTSFQAWVRNDNTPTVPGGDATALSPVCDSGGPGITLSCSTSSGNVPWLLTGPFRGHGRGSHPPGDRKRGQLPRHCECNCFACSRAGDTFIDWCKPSRPRLHAPAAKQEIVSKARVSTEGAGVPFTGMFGALFVISFKKLWHLASGHHSACRSIVSGVRRRQPNTWIS